MTHPYPKGVDTFVLLISYMFLIVKHLIPRAIIGKKNNMTKFVPVIDFLNGRSFKREEDIFSRAICKAIVLVDNDGVLTPIELIANRMYQHLATLVEEYKTHKIYSIKIRMFACERNDNVDLPTDEEVLSILKAKCQFENSVSYSFTQGEMQTR